MRFRPSPAYLSEPAAMQTEGVLSCVQASTQFLHLFAKLVPTGLGNIPTTVVLFDYPNELFVRSTAGKKFAKQGRVADVINLNRAQSFLHGAIVLVWIEILRVFVPSVGLTDDVDEYGCLHFGVLKQLSRSLQPHDFPVESATSFRRHLQLVLPQHHGRGAADGSYGACSLNPRSSRLSRNGVPDKSKPPDVDSPNKGYVNRASSTESPPVGRFFHVTTPPS